MVIQDQARSPRGLRLLYDQRASQLRSARQHLDIQWRDIDQHLLPSSTRFFASDRNRRGNRWNDIIDNSGSMALDRLQAGMMSYGTSPARPWLRYKIADADLNIYRPVAEWLSVASQRTLDVFDRSNTYQALPQYYEQCGAFGTAGGLLLPDDRDIIRHFPLAIGEFWLGVDWRGDVVTLYREIQKTIGEMVAEFGYDNCSPQVRASWTRGANEDLIWVCHLIEPRSDRDTSKLDQANMAWRSVYFEKSGDSDTLLREGGFDYFPALTPRWKIRPGDTYASDCPGMRAMGDIRQLQHEQAHKADVLNQIVDPATQAPQIFATKPLDMLPGGRNYYDQNSPHGGIRRAIEVQIDHTGLLEDIRDIRGRIERAFYADLFAMLSMISDTTHRTRAEIFVREEEKMAMLGPVSRQMNRELRAPMINITFRELLEGGHLPPPPPELHGMELDVEFLDVFSQAQKQIGVNSNDRLLQVALNLAQPGAKPEVMDLLDGDAVILDYADRFAVNPKLVLSANDPRVRAIREARARAQSAQAQAAMMAQQASTAKDMSGASLEGSSVLSNLVGSGGALP